MPVSRSHRLSSGRTVEIATATDLVDLDVGGWPEFMRHNRVSEAYFARTLETFPATCLTATCGGRPIADAQAVQFSRRNRPAFPAGGWEQAVVWAFSDAHRGIEPDVACALNISVSREFQGDGVAALVLAALREATADLGLTALDAPVRPTHKHLEPNMPMYEYVTRVRPDRLPSDPWLRTHVRAGGRIAGIAPASWVIAGSLDEWRSWTGLPFDRNAPVEVPGALVPVDCMVEAERAVYVEPNVWVRHELSTD
jgi:hypothetical protein